MRHVYSLAILAACSGNGGTRDAPRAVDACGGPYCSHADATPDATPDATRVDAAPDGAPDATVPDATVPDAAPPDAPVPDAALPDAPPIDAATPSVCGDSILGAGEQCDDGNRDNGDGCDANCTLPACGNSVISGFETCDDGNLVVGDGCSDTCGIECPDPQAPLLVRGSEDTPIPDGGSINYALIPATSGTVATLRVILDRIDHPALAQLSVTLTAPDTTVRTLVDGQLVSGANYFGTALDDAAPGLLSAGTAPFTGRFRPAQTLSSGGDFLGTVVDGTWLLQVSDNSVGAEGTLYGWTLWGCVVPPPTAVARQRRR